MTDLAGKVAIVTGGASGIGRVIAERFAAAGARVGIADIREDAARSIVDLLPPDTAIAGRVDVAVEPEIESFVAAVLDRFGHVDILCNSAAALGADTIARDHSVSSLDPVVWQRTLAVNLTGAALAIKHVLPAMTAQRSGSIVNISSILSLRGDTARTAYSASKAALNTLTASVAVQHGADGVRCNAVAPGTIVHDGLLRKMDQETLARIVDQQLVPRPGRPEDIAAAVTFLASDEASFITGQTLLVDGGYLAHVPVTAGPVRTQDPRGQEG